ncbi:hypothetical protein T459_15308 [Capsicum annuum]|uniref:Nuclear pore complex protein NUP1-like n=1 Tax=Capsicum annuum TaxID=4072 RepID=A0A2G2ZJY4_CAPAN|nr:hypothetical protein T459_15308 [Capsicum annuum]
MGLFNGILKTGPPCMFSYARGDQVLSLYVLASKGVICPVSSFLSSSNPLTPEVVPPSFGSDKSKEPSGDKVPALVFSSSSPLSVLRPESSSSLSNPALGLAGASSKLFELESSQKDGKSNGKLEPLSSGFSPSTLFAALSSTSSFSNGQLASSTAISSISFLTSSNSPRDVPSGSSSVVAPSTSILAAVGSTTGNSITSSGGLSVATTSIQSQSSLFITGAQSLVSVQTCLAGSDNTTVSQTVPAHFGYSTKLPEVGNSGMTSFSSVGSSSSNTGLVSAAASASNPVGANADTFGNFSFGTSSSASSTMVNSVGPGSGTTQPAFAFGASPAVSAATSALATSNNVTSSMFYFGGGSSAYSTNTISTSINATLGIFSFGGSSSASSTNTVSTSTSATPGMFSFGGSSSVSSTNTVSTSTSATPGMFSFGASSSVSSTDTVSTSTRATPSIFNFGASSSVSSANAVNASSTVRSNPFAFGASSASPQTSSTAGIFSSNWQAPKSPGFGSPFSSATPIVFGFGASSSSFAAPTTTAAPIFGNSNSPFTAIPGNNNQMDMEDSMTEDSVHASSPAVAFSQPSVLPSPGGFGFGSTPYQFQFGSQQNTVAQNPSPFAASGSFGGGGSFSLGSNDPEKSGRKIVKVNRNKNRRK